MSSTINSRKVQNRSTLLQTMKQILGFILLIASTQAIDFTKLKPKNVSPPQIYPRYTAPYWDYIFKRQDITPKVYPEYKKGVVTQPGNAGKVLVQPNSRIVGGQIATHGQFPWQAFISMDNSYACGGSLITEEWILTAGHCAADFSNFIILLGAQNIRGDEADRITVRASSKRVHEGYDPQRIDNDIALLRLYDPIKMTQYINAVRLPSSNYDLKGATVTVSGWGKPSDNAGGISDELRYVSMPVMENAECAQVYGDIITESKICTDTMGGHSSCNGDSGGPLVYQESDGRYTEVGIVSFGAAAGCEEGYPAAFTRVGSFLDWINEAIN